jgi:hypothetical protein
MTTDDDRTDGWKGRSSQADKTTFSVLSARERLASVAVIRTDEGTDDGTDVFIIILYNKNKMFLFHFCIFVYLDASLKFGERRHTSFFFK